MGSSHSRWARHGVTTVLFGSCSLDKLSACGAWRSTTSRCGCVVDPAGLDEAVGRHDEAPVPEFGGLRRRVNRNDRAVTATVVAGNRLYGAGEFAADWGRRRTGRFLRAGERGAADRPAPRNGGGPAALDGPG